MIYETNVTLDLSCCLISRCLPMTARSKWTISHYWQKEYWVHICCFQGSNNINVRFGKQSLVGWRWEIVKGLKRLFNGYMISQNRHICTFLIRKELLNSTTLALAIMQCAYMIYLVFNYPFTSSFFLCTIYILWLSGSFICRELVSITLLFRPCNSINCNFF